MSKIVHNIKEKLFRRKSTQPSTSTKQTTASNTEANARTSPGNDHGKAKEATSKEPTFSIQPHPAVCAFLVSRTINN
jgi:hypothetical protein